MPEISIQTITKLLTVKLETLDRHQTFIVSSSNPQDILMKSSYKATHYL